MLYTWEPYLEEINQASRGVAGANKSQVRQSHAPEDATVLCGLQEMMSWSDSLSSRSQFSALPNRLVQSADLLVARRAAKTGVAPSEDGCPPKFEELRGGLHA